jgi:hypothetical protein
VVDGKHREKKCVGTRLNQLLNVDRFGAQEAAGRRQALEQVHARTWRRGLATALCKLILDGLGDNGWAPVADHFDRPIPTEAANVTAITAKQIPVEAFEVFAATIRMLPPDKRRRDRRHRGIRSRPNRGSRNTSTLDVYRERPPNGTAQENGMQNRPASNFTLLRLT